MAIRVPSGAVAVMWVYTQNPVAVLFKKKEHFRSVNRFSLSLKILP